MNKLTAQDILIAVNIFDDSFRAHGRLFQNTAAQVEFRTRDGEGAGYYWNRKTGFKGFITRTDFDRLDDSGAFNGLVSGRDWDYITDFPDCGCDSTDGLDETLADCGIRFDKPLTGSHDLCEVRAI